MLIGLLAMFVIGLGVGYLLGRWHLSAQLMHCAIEDVKKKGEPNG